MATLRGNIAGAAASGGSAGGYFVEHRRGEVNELHTLLRDPTLSAVRRRAVVERVIAYMTLGIDVSRLFSDMIMATHTRDLVQKKLVYLYISTYAQSKPELALLAINTLQKDCRDDDPMVRGLALRSLCSLRVPKLVEYITLPIRKGLNDPSPYMRKTAVVGTAKLFAIAPEAVRNSDLIDILYNMLRDPDVQVVHNVIHSLNEILADEGGMVINQPIAMHLLNRIREFNEWAQCIVLDVAARYTPASTDELFDIMNLLEDRLKHSNSAVVLATTKVFLQYTRERPNVHQDVLARLKVPLLTFANGGCYEIVYPVLSHIKLIVQSLANTPFDADYKSFFVRYNDPSCIKALKLDILTALASNASSTEIMNELSEYVTDDDESIARQSINSIGRIAIKVAQAADEAVEHLLSFLDLRMEPISAESCIVIKDLLRKYPDRYEQVLPAIHRTLKALKGEQGRMAVIWMIGEYGDVISDSPYILETLIDSWDEQTSRAVRLELLTATVKLFFKRPPEVHQMMGRVLRSAMQTSSEIDVRDRALLYYRLLREDVHEAARVINCPKVAIDALTETNKVALWRSLNAEFNTFSVVLEKPSNQFIIAVPLLHEEEGDIASAPNQDPNADESGTFSPLDEPEKSVDPPIDLLSLEGPTSSSIAFESSSSCDPSVFQAQWRTLPVGSTFNRTLGNGWKSQYAPGVDSNPIERLLNESNVHTIASGAVGNLIKMYFYAQAVGDASLAFIEIVVDLSTNSYSVTCKSASVALADRMPNYMDSLLGSLH